jgi:hypothetical protein
MANKRIKDLETLDGLSLQGAEDYLVVDDVSGNTSKMTVDNLIKNSGPFTDVALLGPPSIHHGNIYGFASAYYISTDIFAYGSTAWGQIRAHGKAGDRVKEGGCTFTKAANTSVMTTMGDSPWGELGNRVITKTIQNSGSGLMGVVGGVNDRGVLKNPTGSTLGGQAFTLLAQPWGANIVQFGEGGFSIWGNASSGRNNQHRAFTGMRCSFMILSWAGA